MKSHVLKYALALTLLLVPIQSVAGTILDTERRVGKLSLGMSEKEFRKVTGIKPGYCPGDSEREETCAKINCEKAPNLCKTAPDVTDIEVLFWKKKLYYLIIGMKEIPIEKAGSHFTKKYGPPQDKFNQGTPGLRIIKWGNKNTEISVVYSIGDSKAFILHLKDLSQNTDGAQF